MHTKYYCDESLKDDDYDKWLFLLDYAFNKADQVEFNILYFNNDLNTILQNLADDFILQGKRTDKIYQSGQFIRYRLSDSLKKFVQSKKYSEWNFFVFEDISFLKGGKEFFATITHENYIIIRLTEEELFYFNKIGFNFNIDWGNDPVGKKEKSFIKKLYGLFKSDKTTTR